MCTKKGQNIHLLLDPGKHLVHFCHFMCHRFLTLSWTLGYISDSVYSSRNNVLLDLSNVVKLSIIFDA